MKHTDNINVKHFFLTDNDSDRGKSLNYAVANIIQQHMKNKTTVLV